MCYFFYEEKVNFPSKYFRKSYLSLAGRALYRFVAINMRITLLISLFLTIKPSVSGYAGQASSYLISEVIIGHTSVFHIDSYHIHGICRKNETRQFAFVNHVLESI